MHTPEALAVVVTIAVVWVAMLAYVVVKVHMNPHGQGDRSDDDGA